MKMHKSTNYFILSLLSLIGSIYLFHKANQHVFNSCDIYNCTIIKTDYGCSVAIPEMDFLCKQSPCGSDFDIDTESYTATCYMPKYRDIVCPEISCFNDTYSYVFIAGMLFFIATTNFLFALDNFFSNST